MQAVKIRVFGLVQGVGFRYSTKMIADKLAITGIVWNISDGTVKIIAQGADEQLQKFIQAIKASPSPFANVERIEVESTQPDPTLHGFRTA
ncbi:MAG: acylphosphatase [Lactobacillaceae bacterium]|jgi:acylphosphatase|nr:acylphosphatase [Lactobacillaceae bacterium]